MSSESVAVAWSTRASSTSTRERPSLAHQVPSVGASFTLCGRLVPVEVRNHLRAVQPPDTGTPLTTWEDPSQARECQLCKAAGR